MTAEDKISRMSMSTLGMPHTVLYVYLFSLFYRYCSTVVNVAHYCRIQKRENEKDLTKSASGITTRFSLRRRENALDLRIPNAQKKSSSVIGEGKSFLLGSMISFCSLRNSFCTYSFTPNVVFRS